jgi:hypothetical protein
MIDANMIFNNQEFFYNMIPIKMNKTDDNKVFHLSKHFAKIEVNELYYKLIYDESSSTPSISFKYFDNSKDEPIMSFTEKLNQYLVDTIGRIQMKKEEMEHTFFTKNLREFLKNNPIYEIYMVFENEGNKKLKLDKISSKIKSYDWDYFSEIWFKNKNHFQNSQNFENFCQLARNSYIIELKIFSEIKSDELKEVYLFLFDNPLELKDFLTSLKYASYFSEQALGNYFYSYVIDLIFNFILPSSDLISFYKNIGIMYENTNSSSSDNSNAQNDSYSTIFPLHDTCLALENEITLKKVFSFNKLKHGASYESFVKSFNHYEETFLSSDKFRLDLKDSNGIERNNTLVTHCFNLKVELDKIFSNSKNYEKFFFFELKKAVGRYISFKGIFNIDIILTNENVRQSNPKIQKLFKYICFIPKCIVVDIFNKILKCNEGFFHKHIQMFDFSYSFNERNVIHNFHSNEDSSQKNKIRIFDILFRDRWVAQIASIISLILHFQSNFYRQENRDTDKANQYLIFSSNIINRMRKMIFKIFQEVVTEFFEDFPAFNLFCSGLYKFPIKKYNHVDNVCHHFADYSVKTLLKNNFLKFSYDVINQMKIVNKDIGNVNSPVKNFFPQIDTLYEECFILYDKDLNNYLTEYFSLDGYLYKTYKKLDDFINNLKEIDCELNRFSLMAMNKEKIKDFDIYNTEGNTLMGLENPLISEKLETFPYAMYFNLYHFHKFEIMKNLYFDIFLYRKDSSESIFNNMNNMINKLNELTFLIKNMTYKFYLYANYIRERLDKNKLKYPSSLGHYLMQIDADNIKRDLCFYNDIYLLDKQEVFG